MMNSNPKGILVLLLLFCLISQTAPAKAQVHDAHVHILSPKLIRDWKSLGIPFSHPDAYYADIDTILARSGAETLDLISMGYVYYHPELYAGEDAYAQLRRENDYVLSQAGIHPERVRPFFAIHPLSPEATEEIDRCVSLNPKAGVKLHFRTSQVYLTEAEHLRMILEVFKTAAELRLTILLHFDNGHDAFGAIDFGILVDSILAVIPAVELRIAHFGTSGGFNQHTRDVLTSYQQYLFAGKVPNRHQVYFDISAVVLARESEGVPALTDSECIEVRNWVEQLGPDRVLFGTDYPLYQVAEYMIILKEKAGLSQEILDQISRKQKP